ncbi:MAG TPA: hypothetical protein VKJ65_13925, partial [Phycisphaerae bacterium]|nr:hypothetical protein [Phycisphaerae bacterium]
SACTQHQILAAMSSCITLLAIGILFQFTAGILAVYIQSSWTWPVRFRQLLNYLAIGPHMDDFARGIIDTQHVAYFLTGTALFLFLTWVVIESRKWR